MKQQDDEKLESLLQAVAQARSRMDVVQTRYEESRQAALDYALSRNWKSMTSKSYVAHISSREYPRLRLAEARELLEIEGRPDLYDKLVDVRHSMVLTVRLKQDEWDRRQAMA